MYDRYRFNILIILDELFAVKKERLIDFSNGVLEGMEKYGWDFDWMFQTHANARFDLESLKLAKKAGCYMFSYGLESASPTVLKSMNKKMDITQVGEVIKMAEEAGIGFSANLIFGDIAETPETIAESMAFWLEYGKTSNIFPGEVKPYPGSKLFEVCQERGMFKDKREYYEHINTFKVNMTSMSDELYNELINLAFYMENKWLFPKKVLNPKYEIETTDGLYRNYVGGDYYKITGGCPHCGKGVEYRQLMSGVPFWLGTGCTHCGKKLKVEVS